MVNRVSAYAGSPGADRPQTGSSKRGLRRWFFGAAMLFGLVLVACSQGTYPLELKRHEAQGNTMRDLIDRFTESYTKPKKKHPRSEQAADEPTGPQKLAQPADRRCRGG